MYKYDHQRASIEYSKRPCTVEFSHWNVVRETVISIWVTLTSNQLSAATLNLTQKKFTRILDNHRPQIVRYRNETDGIEYSVEEDTGRVVLVNYYPAAADRYLNCSSLRQAEAAPIFEQYGVISTKLEKAILDNFSIQLINDPALTGKVILNQGKYSPKFAAKKLRYIKNYLFNQRRVPPNRISAFEVKRARDFSVALYLVSGKTQI